MSTTTPAKRRPQTAGSAAPAAAAAAMEVAPMPMAMMGPTTAAAETTTATPPTTTPFYSTIRRLWSASPSARHSSKGVSKKARVEKSPYKPPGIETPTPSHARPPPDFITSAVQQQQQRSTPPSPLQHQQQEPPSPTAIGPQHRLAESTPVLPTPDARAGPYRPPRSRSLFNLFGPVFSFLSGRQQTPTPAHTPTPVARLRTGAHRLAGGTAICDSPAMQPCASEPSETPTPLSVDGDADESDDDAEDVMMGDVVEVEFLGSSAEAAAEASINATPEVEVAPRRLSVDRQRPADDFRPPVGSNSAADEDGSATTSDSDSADEAEKAEAAATAACECEDSEEEGYVPPVDEAYDPYVFIRRLLPLVGRETPPPGAPCNVLGPKPASAPRVTLVLDLDETLVHASTEGARNPDVLFPVTWNGIDYRVFATKRPFLEEFMSEVCSMFEIVVFTASQRVYASKLLDVLDPSYRWFHHRLYRDSCVFLEGNYLKDLSVLGRDLATTVIVDNSPQAFGLQYNNGIPILSWFDDENDSELIKLLPFLRKLAAAKDVRPLLRARYKLYRRIEGDASPMLMHA